MIKVILGPPGTGKTTKLIDICKEAINNGVSKEKIGYLSFTRKAATEAISRATNFFGTESELPYFRTIHSLAFRSLKLNRQQVFSTKHLALFAHQYGYEFTQKSAFAEDGTFVGRTTDDKCFFLMNLARNKTVPLTGNDEVDISTLHSMVEHYTAFKNGHRLIDYTDMLHEFYTTQLHLDIPELDLLCIDEAQDLSTLQWRCVSNLIARAKQVYIAGDDDQAIYEWAGADLKKFMEYAKSSESMTLAKSYRYGYGIYWQGQRVLAKIKKRIYKPYVPVLNEKGSVTRLNDIDTIPDGQTLILARSFYLLKEVIDFLNEEYLGSWSYTTDKSYTTVKVGTIHSVKGGEADNVILLMDMSQAASDLIHTDAEHRVWYTAVTRAKKHLFLVEPKTKWYYEI